MADVEFLGSIETSGPYMYQYNSNMFIALWKCTRLSDDISANRNEETLTPSASRQARARHEPSLSS